MPLSDDLVAALREARVGDPFSVLGLHFEGETLWARAWIRHGAAVSVVRSSDGARFPLHCRHTDGLFEGPIPGARERFHYRLAVRYHGDDEREWLVADPYSFWPQLADFDLDLFRAGHHCHLGEVLGAHLCTVDGVEGVRFAVWAPNAARVSVVGDWNGFDGRWHPMRLRQPYGVWELFIPGVQPGMLYKYEIRTRDGQLRVKADPCAWQAERPPATASIVAEPDRFAWTDQAWMEARRQRDPLQGPMSIYEVCIGSWMRGEEPHAWPNWRVLAQRLIPYVTDLGYTHLELLPIAQHPYEGSWGYQVTGQYAPNSRHGSPDDLRWFIDRCHAAGLGVIIDFVPGHFPKDDFGLARFDGTCCYEYEDPREGEHKTWGTCVFNFRRPEVRNFLIAAALHWCRHYHIDGLRVDAVASMLYRDYDRRPGEWIPNDYGGNANEEAKSFLQELTSTVRREFPGVVLCAEESTAWAGVTAPSELGGLGFHLKWNMGWMHDTLGYLAQDPVMRSGCHNRITFHQWYAYDERWVLPLSHDEVVHGKRSLIDKMPGDWWRRRAQLRLLFAYQIAVPGRPLLFMGGEWGQGREWDWARNLDWHEAAEPERAAITAFLRTVLALYKQKPQLHARDDHRDGFQWVDCDNWQESVLAFLRKCPGQPDILAAFNFTPVPRRDYPLGVWTPGPWKQLTSSDELRYGGSGLVDPPLLATSTERRGVFPYTLRVTLPPLGAVFWEAPS
ncbi:MAG: 1,4-alpha-glucan branching protein GlgB [Planctomycetota bacterium]|nr:1,4-alpha-glucan branching protein GlgB [Planctomycetota bacterium]MDW8373126.1 1,4-alpha-glucan branching protein GlgB [Planctomycetota bacterium]